MADQKIMVNAKHLNLIEQVEQGDIAQSFTLNYWFSRGHDGFPRNYKMASYYIQKLKDWDEFKEIPTIRFNTFAQEGDCERAFENYDKAVKAYEEALKIMAIQIPFKEWDFKFLKQISELEWMNHFSSDNK